MIDVSLFTDIPVCSICSEMRIHSLSSLFNNKILSQFVHERDMLQFKIFFSLMLFSLEFSSDSLSNQWNAPSQSVCKSLHTIDVMRIWSKVLIHELDASNLWKGKGAATADSGQMTHAFVRVLLQPVLKGYSTFFWK